eukprot:CAMPEP_0181090442 /NCGR_PEP_ID=MMETSP1071-20121207/7860_1 /TAXON_ID=35127 /ORGANISM="Thalassiosira sp., Strain NH16" /LENGTH=80 /DNA_ID=CAMNT_0023172501 /DNA_START=263 /DNA_END=501 /DNA_ORIENTATION=+
MQTIGNVLMQLFYINLGNVVGGEWWFFATDTDAYPRSVLDSDAEQTCMSALAIGLCFGHDLMRNDTAMTLKERFGVAMPA